MVCERDGRGHEGEGGMHSLPLIGLGGGEADRAIDGDRKRMEGAQICGWGGAMRTELT